MAAGEAIRYISANSAAFGNRQEEWAMLDSVPKLAEHLLSSSLDLLPHFTTVSPMPAGEPRLMPWDPSTLALGVAGIVTLAVYVAATGWRKPRSNDVRPPRLSVSASDRRRPTDHSEKPTRGAA
jgi:hypothetical protein